MDERERAFEGEAGAPAERVVALPVEGATQAPMSDERAFEGEAPTALPVEGATQAPMSDERAFEGEAPTALPVEGATQAPMSDERAFEGEAPTALPVEGATQAPIIAEDWGKGLRVYSDDDDDRNRFLTLAMGECWHDFDTGCPVLTCKGGGFICGTCRDFVIANNDFGTEEDFLKLLVWAKRLPELREVMERVDESTFTDSAGRRAFADRVYEVLRKDR